MAGASAGSAFGPVGTVVGGVVGAGVGAVIGWNVIGPMLAKPPENAYDPYGPKAPGKPGEAEGFKDPKGARTGCRIRMAEEADGKEEMAASGARLVRIPVQQGMPMGDRIGMWNTPVVVTRTSTRAAAVGNEGRTENDFENCIG